MAHLKCLYLTGCIRIEELPDVIGCLEYLKELDITGTRITHLPKSIYQLKSPRIIDDDDDDDDNDDDDDVEDVDQDDDDDDSNGDDNGDDDDDDGDDGDNVDDDVKDVDEDGDDDMSAGAPKAKRIIFPGTLSVF